MAGTLAFLFNHKEQSVAVAVVIRLAHILAIARRFPLAPVLLSRTTPEPSAASFHGLAQRIGVHPRHHQHLTRAFFLNDRWYKAIGVVGHCSKLLGSNGDRNAFRHGATLAVRPPRHEQSFGRHSELEVEAGASFREALGSNSVNISLTKDDVVVAAHFDLVTILGAEQHLITRFHGTDIGTDRHDFGPHQALADLRCCRNENSASGTALTLWSAQVHENSIIQHLDRKFFAAGAYAVGQSIGGLRRGHDTTVPSPFVTDDFAIRSLRLETSDGLSLEAELIVPENARAAVVLCHPHPQQGGNMTSLVTSELFRALPASALAVLRFNFRGVGASEGEHDFGIGETLDIVAAINTISSECPELPVFVSGWSFGADTSLSVLDSRIAAWLACAPPLRVLPLQDLTAAAGSDPRLKLLIIPEHDQFRDPDSALEATASWLNTEVVAVAGADHFFVGRTQKVAALIVTTIDTQFAT